MDLTISIVSFNTKDALEICIRSVLNHTQTIDREVIVVDNGSTDGSAEMVRRTFPNVRLICNSENRFFSKAHNQAFEISRGEYFLILNSDIEIADDVLVKMVAYLKNHPDVGGLGCHAMASDGSLQRNCSQDYPLALAFLNFTFLAKVFRQRAQRLIASVFYRDWDRQTSRNVDVIPDSLLMVRRASFGAGERLYDENLSLYFTENDLCLRLRKKGFNLFYLATGRVTHAESLSVRKTSPRLISQIYRRDIFHYFSKHHGRLAAWSLRIAIEVTRAIVLISQTLGIHRFGENLVWGVPRRKKGNVST